MTLGVKMGTMFNFKPDLLQLASAVRNKFLSFYRIKFTFRTSQKATLLLVSLVSMCLLSFKMWHCMILAPPVNTAHNFT